MELPLVGGGPPADDVADAGEQVLEHVGAEDGLAGDDAEISRNPLAFDPGRGSDEHGSLRSCDEFGCAPLISVHDTMNACVRFAPSLSCVTSRRCAKEDRSRRSSRRMTTGCTC